MEKYMSARKCLLISFCYLFVTNTISAAKIFVFYWRKGIKRMKNSFEKNDNYSVRAKQHIQCPDLFRWHHNSSSPSSGVHM